MKSELEKLKNLNYASFKECDDLDNIELLFVDFNEKVPDVFSKNVVCGSAKVENFSCIDEISITMFINYINSIIEEDNIINIEEDNKDILISTIEENMVNIPDKSDSKFVIASEYLDDELYKELIDKGYNINKTDELEDEIIFGYKTDIDRPGIILITNEKGIEDYDNLRMCFVGIGFYPGKQYYKMKINNEITELDKIFF